MQDAAAIHVTVKEFDAGRFAAYSAFDQGLVNLYKQVVPKPFWHSHQKIWVFRDETYKQLMELLTKADFPGASSSHHLSFLSSKCILVSACTSMSTRCRC